jgi:hypothetical protein
VEGNLVRGNNTAWFVCFKFLQVRHIDHISFPSQKNHKCGLLHYELQSVKYTGGGTYTRGALLEAQVSLNMFL